ncbi:MAG: right-handed parallel beta-helix repeat-containing protein [Nanoarchaeota archaeon]|nr:right-handed parallel beta-helix repeat-containing protein [Nanoarchaeota archaeon]
MKKIMFLVLFIFVLLSINGFADFNECYDQDNFGYNISSSPVIDSNNDIVCNDTTALVSADILISGNLTLNNFSIIFAMSKQANGARNITANAGSNFIIDNQTNITSDDITLGYTFKVEADQFSMKNSYLSGCGYSDTINKGLLLYTNDSIIVNNTIYNNTNYALWLVTSNNSLIENNTFFNNSYSIVVTDSDFVDIVNNSIVNEDNYGIYVYNQNTNTTIERNTITFDGTVENDAIHINNANQNTTVQDNNISFNKNGIFLDDYTQDTRVMGNNIFNSTEYGIQVYCRNDRYIIENNTIYYNNNGIGIIADGSKNCPNNYYINISYNNITQNTGAGVNITWSSVFIMNNSITTNEYGILGRDISSMYNINNSYNNISANTYGIYYSEISDGVSNMYLDNNVIEDSSYAIYTNDISTPMYFNNNSITGSTTYDVYNINSAGAIFTNIGINNTTASFNGVDFTIKDEPNPPANTTGLISLDSYLNITNTSTDSWIYLNLTYDESKSTDEDKIRLWEHDETSWSNISSTVDTTNNYVYGNITSFSIFAVFEDVGYPQITIQFPTNTTYATNWFWANVTVDETVDWCGADIDSNTTNVTLTNSTGNWNLNITNISDGNHNITFFCNDTAGNMNYTDVNFTIDTAAPIRSAGSPSGSIYSTSATVSLTTNEAAVCRYATSSGIPYSSMLLPTSSSTSHSWPVETIVPGTYTYYVRCNDTFGNYNTDDYTTSFTKTVTTTGDTGSIGTGDDDTDSGDTTDPSDTGTETSIADIPLNRPYQIPSGGLCMKVTEGLCISVFGDSVIVYNVTAIDPNQFKVLLCNQTYLEAFEINVTADNAYLCFDTTTVDTRAISIYSFDGEWNQLTNVTQIGNQICGRITSTPYMVAGFKSSPTQETALNSIILAESRLSKSFTEEAQLLLDRAREAYFNCGYDKAYELSQLALRSIPIQLPEISVIWMLVALLVGGGYWYYKYNKKKQIKKEYEKLREPEVTKPKKKKKFKEKKITNL